MKKNRIYYLLGLLVITMGACQMKTPKGKEEKGIVTEESNQKKDISPYEKEDTYEAKQYNKDIAEAVIVSREQKYSSDFRIQSLSALEEKSDAIVVAKIVKKEQINSESESGAIEGHTLAYAQIEMCYKGGLEKEDKLTIFENVNYVERDGKQCLFTQDYYYPLLWGEEYLLFLTEREGVYYPTSLWYGKYPYSNLKVDDWKNISCKELEMNGIDGALVPKENLQLFWEVASKYYDEVPEEVKKYAEQNALNQEYWWKDRIPTNGEVFMSNSLSSLCMEAQKEDEILKDTVEIVVAIYEGQKSVSQKTLAEMKNHLEEKDIVCYEDEKTDNSLFVKLTVEQLLQMPGLFGDMVAQYGYCMYGITK